MKRFAATLKERDRIIFGLKEKQLANEQALMRAEKARNQCIQLIQKQRALLKRTTGEYKELTERVREGSVQAQQLKKLAGLIMDYIKNPKAQGIAASGQAASPPPPPSSEGAAGWLNAAAAAALCRRLGFAPSEAEVSSLQEETGDHVSLSAFGAFCRRVAHAEDDAHALASFFEPWDPSASGFITKRQLKHILTSFGDCLSPEEAQLALDLIAEPGDRVNYLNFCQKQVKP
ncbi:hypothetical protein Emag_002038 [Eimeria magna]